MAVRLFRKTGNIISESTDFADIFDEWKGKNERWLFISPHDDDVVIASGILLQKAVEEKIDIRVVVSTDGSMGYCDTTYMNDIAGTRCSETKESFALFGINDIVFFGFPDTQLYHFAGRRKAEKDDPYIVNDFTGLQNAYTFQMRDFRPTRIFVPSGADLHPDHKITYQETLISLFHCGSSIWPELGDPLSETPLLHEMAVYCDFIGPPDVKVQGDDANLEKKLAAISAYRSQEKVIDALVTKLRSSGPSEYFRDAEFNLYSPANYSDLFS